MSARKSGASILAVLALSQGGLVLPGRARAAEEPRVITITAKRFEFLPKEINVKQGEAVKLRLFSEDVTHGFFSKPLGLDETIYPGKTTEVTLTPREPGRYKTICDHFCGSGHGNMSLTIVVE